MPADPYAIARKFGRFLRVTDVADGLDAVGRADLTLLSRDIRPLWMGVRFFGPAGEVYVRVDADLPVNPDSSLAYSQFGYQESIWVPIFEKAYAFYRLGDGQYQSLAGGFSGEIFEDLGLLTSSTFTGSSGKDLLLQLAGQLGAGQAVVMGTDYTPGDAPVIPGHAYTVLDVGFDETGRPVSLRLMNPWGRDGAGDDGANDGVVTLTPAQAMEACWFSVAGYR